MNSQPFQPQKNGCSPNQGNDVGAGPVQPRRRLVEHERSERQDHDACGGEKGRAEDRYVPEIVPRQCEVTEAKWNFPTLSAGATVEPNEA